MVGRAIEQVPPVCVALKRCVVPQVVDFSMAFPVIGFDSATMKYKGKKL